MKEKIKENNHQENDPVLTKPTQEEWEKVFAQREEFLGVKMTTKQKEG
jgi:hypothetical protein